MNFQIIITMDIRNSDLLLDFVETIEFSENLIPKKEIKEEEGLKIEKQEFSKTPSFDVKPKLEPVEASEIGQGLLDLDGRNSQKYLHQT